MTVHTRILMKASRIMMRGLLCICLPAMLFMATTATAQVSAVSTPKSQMMALTTTVPMVELPVTNVQDYIAEDATEPKDVPPRFGIPIEVSCNLETHGEWTVLPDGGRVWRFRISSPDAYSINLVYDQFYMPAEAEFHIYNDFGYTIGAFTSFNNKDDGMFATQPVPGDAVTLEYYEPAAVVGQGELSIMTVVHAYRNVFGYRESNNLDDYGDSGSCNNNVACDTEWDNQEQGVVMLLEGSFRYCSGSLINTVGNPGTPYILTANHCSPGSNDIAMFNYESPTCANANGPTNQTIQGGTQRFTTNTSSSSDCFLWQLNSSVPLSYNPYYNGWNANNTAASSAVGIHHPSGDVKKISWENAALQSTDYLSNTVNANETHWRVVDWDDGTTEGGSSGSPLFDQNHRIVGQLHGGYASCSNNSSDWYGKFSLSMTSGLRAWLDPATTNVMTLDGYDPNAAAPSITVTSPNTAVTWYVGEANNITWTSENFAENVQIHINRSYPGGAWEQITASTANDGSYGWTVTSPTTSAARIRVRGATTTTVSDESNTNFTIAQRSITVTAPNTAVTWAAGESGSIQWSSLNITGSVSIELNRSYSGGSWETLAASTTNDGLFNWTITAPATALARIRVTSLSYPTISDVSDVNFSIVEPTITVTYPNGGESLIIGANASIQWTSTNLTGDLSIDLNRSYPGGTWETLIASTTDDGSFDWTVTGPISSTARVRVNSNDYLPTTDVSNANFSIIVGNVAPAIAHDRLDDQNIHPFDVTALVTDDAGGFVTKIYYRLVGAVNYDSLTMGATGNPDEYALTLVLPSGEYEYFLRVRDAGNLTTETDLLTFKVAEFCGNEQAYDDGSAEASHWSETTSYQWAVRFDAGAGDYLLCKARIGVSALNPTADYSSLNVRVYLADGALGVPGTLVATKSVGSLGNVIGGVPTLVDNWVDVVFTDALGDPLLLSEDFYIAVQNPATSGYDAFLHDVNGTNAARSMVYDPCDEQWVDENDPVQSSARAGNRMIRASGFSLMPPVIAASRAGDDIRLDWNDLGAPVYHVYSALTAEGPFTTLEGTTVTNSFVDMNALVDELKFYVVVTAAE